MTANRNNIEQDVKGLLSVDSLPSDLGDSMFSLIRKLFPLHRSISGDGLRASFDLIENVIDLSITNVPTGTRVFDWEIPMEWSIREAYIEDGRGNRIVDYGASNLHIVGYSTPVNKSFTLDALKPHLHTLPDTPDWIPYRTSFYDENWGFCLTHNEFVKLKDGQFKVVIDSELAPGNLTYAECVVPGATDEEVLIFAHVCHPSLCNDNLSGIVLSTYLAKMLSDCNLSYTYRFVFAPTTIGSIAWLAQNESRLPKIQHGLVLSVIGDSGHLNYKRSRRGNCGIDRAVEHVLSTTVDKFDILDFSPWGYDERQFCSPGINLPVGRLTRTPHGDYPEYHTSADNLTIVKPEFLVDSFHAVWRTIEILEGNAVYVNQLGKGEPQLGRRGLYRKLGGYQDIEQQQLAMLWVLNQSDGRHSLLDIAGMAKMPFDTIRDAANDLIEVDILTTTETKCW